MTTKKKIKAPAARAQKKTAVIPAKQVTKSPAKPTVKGTSRATVKTPKKEHKKNVVRDSFTMPQSEYQKIAEIKAICLKTGMHVKKSEVLRAGLKALAGLNTAQLKRALSALEKIKTGRPKKH
jgi:hypothetical protein